MRCQLIGKGSIGNVYLTKNETEQSGVIVKKLDLPQEPEHADYISRDQIKAIKKEVNILKKLRHSNIVSYLGAFKSADSLKITQEYEPSITLDKWIEARKTNGGKICEITSKL